MSYGITRREFFERGGRFGAGLWLVANMPLACRAAQDSTERLVLSAEQWKTVRAITARIIPTDHEPGAEEAGCVNFIDKALAHEDAALRPQYEAGLPGIDAVARQRFEKTFVELEADQQDAVLAALEAGEAVGWPVGEVSAGQFFETVRTHTVWGFLADPRYGGNRDHVGWKVVGYPGPRHHAGGYTPEQMMGLAEIEPIWRKT